MPFAFGDELAAFGASEEEEEVYAKAREKAIAELAKIKARHAEKTEALRYRAFERGYVGSPKWADKPAPAKVAEARYEALRARFRAEAERTPEPPPSPRRLNLYDGIDITNDADGKLASRLDAPPLLRPRTPEDRWEMYLSAEAGIARAMEKHDRHRRPAPADLSWLGRYEPSTSGFGGGFVGVWRRR